MTAWTETTLTKNIYCIFHKSWFQSLTTWDGGNQLTYPVKYHDIGYKEDLKDKEEDARLTGFQVSIFTSGTQVLKHWLFPYRDNIFV